MRALMAAGAAMAALFLTAASSAEAQSGNNGYCYVLGSDMKTVYVSDLYAAPTEPDTSLQEFGTYLIVNQDVMKPRARLRI
jgi:hypothetical protein